MGKTNKGVTEEVDAVKTALESKVWLRIDANTTILVAAENATAEYADAYRKRLANYRGHHHRWNS